MTVYLYQKDICPCLGESYRHGPADAPGTARDESGVALEGEEGRSH